MPEGPEIRREADALARALAGRELVRVEYRIAPLAARGKRLRDARVLRVYPRGKALLIEFDRGVTHYSHNQLYGQWRVLRPGSAFDDTRAVRVVLGDRGAHRGPVQRDGGRTARHARARATSVSREARPGRARARDHGTAIAARIADPRFARSSLAALLLDQRFIAGLGNYLRSEILHAARLAHTLRPRDLDDAAARRAARAIDALPRQSYRTRGVTNDLAAARADRAAGVPFDEYRFRVYDRAGLPCRSAARRSRGSTPPARGLFARPSCQVEPPRGL